MMLKQVSLAALAATFITGSAAVAYAESNISGVDGGATSSATLRNDGSSSYGGAIWAAPSASMNAYGYASERRLDRSRQRSRNNARMNNN
jgi:hypothetical protein